MHRPLPLALPVTLAVTGLLAAAAVVLPGSTAVAGVDCTPVVDTSSIDFDPRTLAVTSTGYRTTAFSASFSAPCAEENGSDLEAVVIYSSPDIDGSSLLRASDGIYSAPGDHAFGVFELDHVLSGDLRNSFAGTWTTEVSVTDQDDDPVHSYDDEAGPSIRVLRAAKATTDATPEPVTKGHTITVKGRLTRANWNTRKDAGYAGRAVKLQFRTENGSYATVKTVTSAAAGALHATVTAKKDGYYRFAFVGSSTTARAVSAGDHVDVK